MLISLSGVDGCGKSTQVELLSRWLIQRGRTVRALWFRPGYSRRLDAVRGWVRRRRPGLLPPPGPSAAREKLFRRPRTRQLWLATAILDTGFEYAVVLRRHLLAGVDVVCDRFIEDARIDLELRFPELATITRSCFKLVERTCPRPDVHLFLRVDLRELERRLAQKQEPFPDDEAVRAQRYLVYEQRFVRPRYHVVDGSLPAQQIQDAIRALVAERLVGQARR